MIFAKIVENQTPIGLLKKVIQISCLVKRNSYSSLKASNILKFNGKYY